MEKQLQRERMNVAFAEITVSCDVPGQSLIVNEFLKMQGP